MVPWREALQNSGSRSYTPGIPPRVVAFVVVVVDVVAVIIVAVVMLYTPLALCRGDR